MAVRERRPERSLPGNAVTPCAVHPVHPLHLTEMMIQEWRLETSVRPSAPPSVPGCRKKSLHLFLLHWVLFAGSVKAIRGCKTVHAQLPLDVYCISTNSGYESVLPH